MVLFLHQLSAGLQHLLLAATIDEVLPETEGVIKIIQIIQKDKIKLPEHPEVLIWEQF